MPSEVVVVSVGPAAAAAEIRSGLAMGADRGILVKHDAFRGFRRRGGAC